MIVAWFVPAGMSQVDKTNCAAATLKLLGVTSVRVRLWEQCHCILFWCLIQKTTRDSGQCALRVPLSFFIAVTSCIVVSNSSCLLQLHALYIYSAHKIGQHAVSSWC